MVLMQLEVWFIISQEFQNSQRTGKLSLKRSDCITLQINLKQETTNLLQQIGIGVCFLAYQFLIMVISLWAKTEDTDLKTGV